MGKHGNDQQGISLLWGCVANNGLGLNTFGLVYKRVRFNMCHKQTTRKTELVNSLVNWTSMTL